MAKKISVITAILFALLTSTPVVAATDNTSQIPELNPFCWHRIDCHKIRKTFLTNAPSCEGDPSCKELEQGFIKDESVAPCTGGTGADQWGRCLPAGTTKTEISFGGQDEFSNIGEFIILMYKYLLTIASIVAVVVIIIAGMQWVSSGGNSEAISSAKKRISGALIGLFIAYMSYFVLNTINPALVNLRLPQVWLIRPQVLMPEFCSDIPGAAEGKIKFAKVGDASQPNAPLPPPNKRDYILWNQQACGSRFLAESGGEQTCMGSGCDLGDGNLENKTCFDTKGDGMGYECGDVRMGGKIKYTGTATAFLGDLIGGAVSMDWAHPPVETISGWIVCERVQDIGWEFKFHDPSPAGQGSSLRGAQFFIEVVDDVENSYFLSATNKRIDEIVNTCNSEFNGGGVRGIVLVVDMKAASTGSTVAGGAVAGGVVGSYIPVVGTVIGAVGGGLTAYLLEDSTEVHYLGRNGVDLGNDVFFEKNNKQIDKKHFYTVEELKKGIRLNIDADSILDVHAGALIGGDQNKANEFYKRNLTQ